MWLGRIRHCRGFGVQSPTDYRFVRHVILEKSPYYKYSQLASDFPDLDGLTRNLCMLYFRLANYCQAKLFIDSCTSMPAINAYVMAGCNKTISTECNEANFQNVSLRKPFLARVACSENSRDILQWLLSSASEDSILVVEGIKEDKEARETWRWLLSHDLATVTYDLYYCGIIITAKRRYKKNYIINF